MERLASSSAQYPDWTGWTFVQPCISVGHVGQLAVDVLITSLRARRDRALYHPALFPVAGIGAYDHASEERPLLNTSLELYTCEEQKVVLMQQRSSCMPGKRADFCNALRDWISARMFKQVVVLSSLDSQARMDTQLHGDQFRYICNSTAETDLASGASTPAALQWLPLEVPTAPFADPNGSNMIGSGLAKRLLAALSECGIATTVVLPFSQAGMQCREALVTVHRLNQWLQVIPAKAGGIRWPKTWDAILPGLSDAIPAV